MAPARTRRVLPAQHNFLSETISPRAPQRDDGALIRAMARGEAGALSELYARYRIRVLALAYRLCGDRQSADEITQEAFVDAWRDARRYDPAWGPVRGWLLSKVRRTSIQAARQRDVAIADVPLDAAWMSAGETDPFDETYTGVRRAQVRACMQRIPREQRTAIEQAYFSGESFAAIARESGVPIGTVKSRVRLGMRKLRRMLTPVA